MEADYDGKWMKNIVQTLKKKVNFRTNWYSY